MPSTSQPSVGDFLAVYEPLLDDGADIVSIHLSAGISGTFTAAEQARDQLVERGIDPARLVVLDSATACAGLGMMAIAADVGGARTARRPRRPPTRPRRCGASSRSGSRSTRSSSCAAAGASAAPRRGSARR